MKLENLYNTINNKRIHVHGRYVCQDFGPIIIHKSIEIVESLQYRMLLSSMASSPLAVLTMLWFMYSCYLQFAATSWMHMHVEKNHADNKRQMT